MKTWLCLNGDIYGSAVYGTGGPDGNSLTEDILNKDIVDIRLERSMWTTKSGDIILIIKDNQ